MSSNKLKYFTVTTTALVKANNKTEAEKLAMSSRRPAGVPGEVLYKDVEIENISAVEAQEQIVG